MTIAEIKKIALEYARKFAADENMQFDYVGDCSADEYFLIQQLAQIYYNLAHGIIDSNEAARQQADRILFVSEHADMFEFDEN